ncbi:hypothetical protein IFM89_036213 [Coptis chinensis]|uniref:CID domain-containing protein n=1 Tax=Coptis chinensis TaxID=261450 RepID=A0A835GZW3_9MAGN|nr:hypothetical protein IFM89_036213 [Coptis chinensis]
MTRQHSLPSMGQGRPDYDPSPKSFSRESIKGAKIWFMQRSPFAPTLAEALRERVLSLGDFERQLHIVYLANDILFERILDPSPITVSTYAYLAPKAIEIEIGQNVLGYILGKFPDVVHDLKQVDTTGISDRYFVKQLRKLFDSLNLKESDDGIFLLPPKCRPTLEVVGPMMSLHERLRDHKLPQSGSNIELMKTTDDAHGSPVVVEEDPAPRRRVIGPEMPSSELLATAAKLTEATAKVRDAEFEFDNDLFIGPAPPAVAASSNEAEHFEEVTRIMEVETGSPYDLLGVNRNMSADNIKKRDDILTEMFFMLSSTSVFEAVTYGPSGQVLSSTGPSSIC